MRLNYFVPQPPLCEGNQVCSLMCQNDSLMHYEMECSMDNGMSWIPMGLLDSENQAQFWRQSGELWRLRSGQLIGAMTLTRPGTLIMRVVSDRPPIPMSHIMIN